METTVSPSLRKPRKAITVNRKGENGKEKLFAKPHESK
jgi:hypothetical protein